MAGYEKYSTIRDKRKMRDADVARQSGVTASTFSDWKSGRSLPKVEKLRKIAAVLDVTIDELVEG